MLRRSAPVLLLARFSKLPYNDVMILKQLGAFLLEIIEIIVFAVSIFLFLYLLVLQPHKIKGSSMEPNFHDGEYLLTDKISYRFNEPKRGDVVVFKAPPDYKEEFIKRIVGLPDETISIRDNRIYINGKIFDENYLPDDIITQNGAFLKDGQEITVPENSYFVLGDNRPHSLDSRRFGFINLDKITGKTWFIYWPPTEVGIVKNKATF